MTNSSYIHNIGRIIAVLAYIESHLEEELSLEEMAKIARISPYHFHRLFHAYMGETLADHVRRLRLQYAAERLQFSDAPITDIALDAGYETCSSFTKVFHQVMGTSPRRYRKTMQLHLQAILKRTDPTLKPLFQPEYVHREEETILFVRRVGDYNETPRLAYEILIAYLQQKKIARDQIKTYYSIALDSPKVIDRSKCRFDACVSLFHPLPPQGEVGQKTLPAGYFAVFTHRGPYSKIENTYEEIFRSWYPSSNACIADQITFCEHIRAWETGIAEEDRITKLYVPIEP
jgi:AraC family transcriptional regulator